MSWLLVYPYFCLASNHPLYCCCATTASALVSWTEESLRHKASYSKDGITPALTLHELTPPKIGIEFLLVYDMAYELKVVPLSLDHMHGFLGVKSSSVGKRLEEVVIRFGRGWTQTGDGE